MKYILCIIFFAVLSVSCATTRSADSQDYSSDQHSGEKLYCAIIGMKSFDSYSEYADFEAARSTYDEWKMEYIRKNGDPGWESFASRMKKLHGEPESRQAYLLDPTTF